MYSSLVNFCFSIVRLLVGGLKHMASCIHEFWALLGGSCMPIEVTLGHAVPSPSY